MLNISVCGHRSVHDANCPDVALMSVQAAQEWWIPT